MNIAIINWYDTVIDLVSSGGLERTLIYEAKLLSSSHSVDVFCKDCFNASSTYRRLRSSAHAQDLITRKEEYKESLRELLHGYDVVHAVNYPEAAGICDTGCVIHFHNQAWLPDLDLRLGEYCRCKFVFPAQWVLQDFRIRFPGIPSESLHIVPGGVDTDKFFPKRCGDRVSGKDNESVRIFFGSVWHVGKGILDLLEAERVLRERGVQGFRLFLGGGPGLWKYEDCEESRYPRKERDALVKKVMGCAEESSKIRIVPEIPHESMPRLLRSMDVLVFPSVWEEVMPLLILEGMACGLAVAVSGRGGNIEIVDHEVTGLVFEAGNVGDLANALERLVADEQLRCRLGQQAAEVIRGKYTWRNHVDKIESIYEHIERHRKKVD